MNVYLVGKKKKSINSNFKFKRRYIEVGKNLTDRLTKSGPDLCKFHIVQGLTISDPNSKNSSCRCSSSNALWGY